MKYLTSIFVVVALLGAAGANADQYRASIEGCKQAIAERLGTTVGDARVRMKSVKSKARYKDYKFTVTTPNAKGSAYCQVRSNGEVLALDIRGFDLPVAQATP